LSETFEANDVSRSDSSCGVGKSLRLRVELVGAVRKVLDWKKPISSSDSEIVGEWLRCWAVRRSMKGIETVRWCIWVERAGGRILVQVARR